MRALEIVVLINVFVILVAAPNVSMSAINYENTSGVNYRIDEYLREIVEVEKSNIKIPVVIVLNEQPADNISHTVKKEYENQFEDIIKPAKEIYKKTKPGIVSNNDKNISELIGLEQSLLTGQEKIILKETGQNLELKTRQMRREILDRASPLVNRTQAPIIEKIKAKGGDIKYSSKILNAIVADVPISYINELSQEQAVHKIYHDYILNESLDISTQAMGSNTWWSNGYTGSVMDAAVVDTGIDASHPALGVDYAGVFHATGRYHPWYADNPLDPDDLQGHGTHVAGIVASTDTAYKGVGYGLDKLINAKAGWKGTDGGGRMYWSDGMQAIDWAIFGNADDADVISLSFGGGATEGDSGFEHFMDSIVSDLDIPVVISAGNAGPGSSTIREPANAFNVIAVGNVNDKNTVSRTDDGLLSSSSRGPTLDGRIKPDISAPGTSIMSANYNWETQGDFVSLTGTSMAAPHMAGSILLILDYKNFRWRPEAVKALLLNTADDRGATGPDYDYGFGYVNLSNTYIHRDDVLTGSINDLPNGSVEKYFKGTASNSDTATLVWNRHVTYNHANYPTSYLDLSDLDLIMYNEANGAQISSSKSRLNNVEQVKSSGFYGPAVLKINPYGTFPAGFEEYALATDQEFVNASPPIINLNVSNPKNVTAGTDFVVNITVDNSGDIPAHNVDTNINLPSDFIIISGTNPQDLGTINTGSSKNATWTVRAPDINLTAQYGLDASASSDSYGEFYSVSGNNTISVISLISLINGTVLDSINKNAISGAVVSTNTSILTITDASGFYSLAVSAGTFNITAELEPTYHTNSSVTVMTESSSVVVQNIELAIKSTGTITGSVTDV